MERYCEYKDSGVQWLGEIPGHWEMSKVSSHFKQRNEKVSDKDYPALSVSKQGVIPQLENVALSNAEGRSRKLVKVGDYAVNSRSDRKGSCGVSKFEGSVSLITIVLEPFNIDGDYVHYLFRSNPWIEEFYRNGRGIVADLWTTNYQMMKSMYMPLPPLSEQHSIVSYLDDKCGKIDKMLEGKQKQIELLAEMKQRIIADAVTRGLNPDVKMKATNIPWLPEIPEHWDVKRGKNLFNKEQRPIEEGDEIVTCFRDGEVTLRKNRRTTGFTEATDYSHYQHICKGDLVIHQMDAFAGSSGVSDSDGMGTPVLSVCTARIEGVNHYYFAYILRLMGKNNFILSLYRGIRERSSDFRFETFAKQYLPVPPAIEQEQIVKFIHERSSKIDALTSKLQQEIESIKEYKQRLISDVVTGQIKVC